MTGEHYKQQGGRSFPSFGRLCMTERMYLEALLGGRCRRGRGAGGFNAYGRGAFLAHLHLKLHLVALADGAAGQAVAVHENAFLRLAVLAEAVAFGVIEEADRARTDGVVFLTVF